MIYKAFHTEETPQAAGVRAGRPAVGMAEPQGEEGVSDALSLEEDEGDYDCEMSACSPSRQKLRHDSNDLKGEWGQDDWADAL